MKALKGIKAPPWTALGRPQDGKLSQNILYVGPTLWGHGTGVMAIEAPILKTHSWFKLDELA